MVELYVKKEECCGCTACMNICPTQAINMIEDEKGFLYPCINQALCIQCGLCKKVCFFQYGYNNKHNFDLPEVYAVKHNSESIRLSSSSGGAFTAISDQILSKDGVIYGADFDESFIVYHNRATTKKGRDNFKGSKYVQSNMNKIFKSIRNDLEENRYVLFSGTSCQVAGLKGYLTKDYEKLYLVDIVCHGTSSPKIFEDYKTFLKNKYKSDIQFITFRHKYIDSKYGPSTQAMKIVFSNKTVYVKHENDDLFCKLFSQDLILRPSCYVCKYANIHKPADITIADYWGVERSLPDFQDGKGISLILINNNKGQEIFNRAKKDLNYCISNLDDCWQMNLCRPSEKAKDYNKFWNDYFKNGFLVSSRKYTKKRIKTRVKGIVITILKKAHLYDTSKRILSKI